MTEVTTPVVTLGKCKRLHALWAAAAARANIAILPRKDAIKLGEASGFNPATCRTQFQVIYKAMKSAPANVAPVETPVEQPAPKLTKAEKRALAKAAADAQSA